MASGGSGSGSGSGSGGGGSSSSSSSSSSSIVSPMGILVGFYTTQKQVSGSLGTAVVRRES